MAHDSFEEDAALASGKPLMPANSMTDKPEAGQTARGLVGHLRDCVYQDDGDKIIFKGFTVDNERAATIIQAAIDGAVKADRERIEKAAWYAFVDNQDDAFADEVATFNRFSWSTFLTAINGTK